MILISGVMLAGAASCLWPTDHCRAFPEILEDTQAPLSRPPVPTSITIPQPVLEVALPRDTAVVYARDVLFIQFEDVTTAQIVEAILTRYRARIIGGYPAFAEYQIRIPDPGLAYAGLDSVIHAIAREPGVRRVRPFELRTRIQPKLVDALPSFDTTRLLLSAAQGDTVLIYRTDIGISFHPGTSDEQKSAFFRRHALTVIGVSPGGSAFFVRMPDPGDRRGYDRVLTALRGEPEVHVVSPMFHTPLETVRDADRLVADTARPRIPSSLEYQGRTARTSGVPKHVLDRVGRLHERRDRAESAMSQGFTSSFQSRFAAALASAVKRSGMVPPGAWSAGARAGIPATRRG